MSSGRGPLWRLQLESGPDNNSPSVVRFLSCRWRKAAEDGVPDHCTHRDVLPMAGKEGFKRRLVVRGLRPLQGEAHAAEA